MTTRSKSRATTVTKHRKKTTKEKENEHESKVFCTCKKGDDGTPMVFCQECHDWYHFTCISLSERDAEDINIYICPSCTESTGKRSVMLWEGPDAVEAAPESKPKPKKADPVQHPVLPEDFDSGGAVSSQDEYHDGAAESTKAKGKRRTRRLAYSDSDSDSSSTSQPRARKRLTKAGSPALKRKPGAQTHPAPKKKKISTEPLDDPIRKYCLSKLEDVFRDIFNRYPHLPNGDELVEKKVEDSTEAEKANLVEESKRFATELEHCVYQTYSEPDKQGKVSAGPKYKDRFRMLQFNLNKSDRVVLHKRIVSGQISAEEIAVMSSTDLANEETKQNIKIAEKEALEHSILQKTTAPRAKITHKGLQDIEIEDINGGEIASLRDRERERDLEQQERMERERMARLKARQRAPSTSSMPPDSPITPSSATWGSAPPLPLHDIHDPQKSILDIVMSEPEMALGDLINIDDEPMLDAQPSPPAEPAAVEAPTKQGTPPPPPSIVPPVGISPFASTVLQPETPRSTFDLSSLWSAPAAPAKESSPPPHSTTPPPKENVNQPPQSQPASSGDQDFDMFLEAESSPEAIQAAFDARPTVWNGKINMPLDSTIPQETPVVARQVAGRPIEAESLLWKTLFPSDLLRIDGRVPVDKSAQFLLQIRMNPSKELIAVAFSPASPANDSAFRILSDFLIAKGRHGLVFPWGSRPKDTHPGRELYIIPLLSSDPVPDFMQLLDNLQLPKIRQVNYLVGIWILGKGKLKAPTPTPPPQQQPAVPASGPSPPPVVPDISHLLPQLSTTLAKLPTAVDQNALAAEVAQLTPAQVQEMIRTLSTVPNPGSGLPPPPLPPPGGQAWPGYHGYYPPPFPPQNPGGLPPPPMPGMGPGGPLPPNAQYGGPPPPPPLPHFAAAAGDRPYRDRPERERGRRGGRGRGGGGGGARRDSPPRQQDHGWPRRGGPPSGTNAQRRW